MRLSDSDPDIFSSLAITGEMIRRILLQFLPWILPMAVRLVRDYQSECRAHGRLLTAEECQIAGAMGVKYPGEIFLLIMDKVPPPSLLLRVLSKVAGLPFNRFGGITLGYGIIFRREHFGRQILAHECRHVYQYERMGIGRFLDEYLRQVLTHGYKHAPLEIDARAAASGLNPSTRAGSC